MKRVAIISSFFITLLVIWELAAQSSRWSPVLFPSALSVAQYLWGATVDGTLFEAISVTLKRLVIGYAIGVAIGLPLGVLTGASRILEDTLGSLALGLQTLPSVCWVPFAVLWFGQTEGAMLFVVVMGTVWSVIIATNHGARTIPPIYARAARTMGSKGLHLWIMVMLPASLPFLVSGMKQGWAFAWRSLMAAELLAQSLRTGVGHLLNTGRDLNDMAMVMGMIGVILVIGLAVDKALFYPLERLVARRWGVEGA